MLINDLYTNKTPAVAEANDPNFVGFMNNTLGDRVDAKPEQPKTGHDWYDNAPTMSMDNMPSYKHAFKFGMSVLQSMDAETKQHFAEADNDELFSYLMKLARKKKFEPKYFVEEDMFEVTGLFSEIFHDPSMQDWEWADLLRSTLNNQGVAEGAEGQVMFRGTGADGSTYEIVQSSPTDFMIHANGKHIDTYGSLQRAMSVLKNEVPGLQQGVAEGSDNADQGSTDKRFEVFYVNSDNDVGSTKINASSLSDAQRKVKDNLKAKGWDVRIIPQKVDEHKQGMAEAQTDYQKRRQRERDVDAGKPVKPPPRNPQNDYFARRKKEKDLAEDQAPLSGKISARRNQDSNSFEDWDYYYQGEPIQPGTDRHTQVKDLHMRQTDPVYDTMRNAFDNPIKPRPDLTRDERQQQMLTTPNLRGPIKITGPNGEQFQFDTPAEANYFRNNMRELYQQDQEREGPDPARSNFVIQAESTSAKKKGMAEDDDAVAAFMARGGEIQRLKSAKPRKGERWQGSAHIGAAGGRGTKGRVSGLGANTGKSGKPVVTAEQGNPVAGQDFTMKDGAQMKWNPTSKSWQQQAPVPGDDGGFNVVSVRDTGHTIDNGNKSTDTFTSTGIFKNPTTGKQQTVADWDHTDPKTGINYIGNTFTDEHGNVRTEKNYKESKKTKVDEVSLGDYRKKATVNKAMAQTNKFFGRDDPAAVAAADRTIAKRERGLGRAYARRQPYTAPPVDQDKQRRALADKYPNIDELVRRAELSRDPQYDRADGPAYYAGREAEQNYQKLKQIQRVIQGLNESLQRTQP